MADREQKPDDAPVTWGELREVTGVLLEFITTTTLYTTKGLSNALRGIQEDPQEKELLAESIKLAAELDALGVMGRSKE